MGATDTDTRESGIETARTLAARGVDYSRTIALQPRVILGIVGGAGLLGGLRALLSGNRKRGLVSFGLGVAFLATAIAKWRSRGEMAAVDDPDVVDTGPDIETLSDVAGDIDEDDHATGEAASAVADTSPDVEAVESDRESDTDTESASIEQGEVADTVVDREDFDEDPDVEPEAMEEAAQSESETGSAMVEQGDVGSSVDQEDLDEDAGVEPEAVAEPADVDRLGEAAFDTQTQEIPAPQRAFNQGFLSHGSEAFWAVRSRDGAVLVSQDYDALQGRDGVQYTASSEIDDDMRELPIPKAVRTHWDAELGGGTAIAGGDDILFVTTDSLAADEILRILPAEWADDVLDADE